MREMKYKFFFIRVLALCMVAIQMPFQVSAKGNYQKIKGQIQNSIYTAKNNMFSIAIPHKEWSYEYLYMHIKEEFHDGQTSYVSFGPAAFNQSIYRVGFYRMESNESLDKVTEKLVENYSSQLESSYQTKLTIRSALAKCTINGKDAYYGAFTQQIPSGIRLIQGKMEPLNMMYRHEVYVIDFAANKAIVRVQLPDEEQADETMKHVAKSYPGISPEAFAESLIIY
jgi:hypothetical protein